MSLLVKGKKMNVLKLPFGDLMLFLVRLPLTTLGRRIGRGVFRRPRYLASTLKSTTPADSDAKTTYLFKKNITLI